MNGYGGENHYLIAADGTIVPLADRGVTVTGLGDIPVGYATSRGYRQHGYTVDDWTLEGRSLSFSFDRFTSDRAAFWQAREELLAALAPTNGMVTYRRVLPDGSRREISGWLQAGLMLDAGEDGRHFPVSFSLVCPDPSFLDPTSHTLALTVGGGGGFALPFSLPDDLWLPSDGNLSGTVAYAGTWRSYPTLAIDGPYQQMTIRSSTTGGTLTLAVPVAAGRTLTVDLAPGAQTFTDDLGNDHLSDLAAGNLLDWVLTTGENVLTAVPSGHGETTAVRVTYNERYIAL